MKLALSFDDVLLVPKYSTIRSRKDVYTGTDVAGRKLQLPIISSNMDTVTGSKMAVAMDKYGAAGALHRFQSIEDNIAMFLACKEAAPFVSVGIGYTELDRAKALYDNGAQYFVLDVAHGGSKAVVEQSKALLDMFRGNAALIVGNFATGEVIDEFEYELGTSCAAYKVGIGGGGPCTTQVVTACGLPTFASILSTANGRRSIIADGGIRTSGDFCKALAGGAVVVFMGGRLAGAEETPGEVFYPEGEKSGPSKIYRGSASQESYQVQGKVAEWRTPEGEAFEVPYTGPVVNTLQKYDAGLRSSMSYLNASTIREFQANADFVQITNMGAQLSKAHGKT